MDTVRIARDLGDVSSLLPEGLSLKDCPHPLFDAIRGALAFLSLDELTEQERPPKRIWLDPKAMAAWFEEVERNRRAGSDPRRQQDVPELRNPLINDLIAE